MNIAIVTDSTADIPDDLAQQHNLLVVPNLMYVEGQSLKDDGKSISRQKFYEWLPEMKTFPTTGTASSGTYQELYESILKQGAKHILSIHTSSQLSGIVNAAHSAAQLFDDRVHVVDSQSVSLGLGFQVLEAAEAVERGDALETILALLAGLPARSRVVAMLDTLEYVRRSGRVSWARARLGNLLNIKPFVEVKDGLVHSLGEARTRRKGTERLQQLLFKQGRLKRLAILHSNAEADARNFLAEQGLQLPTTPLIVNITPVIGSHVGPNCLGFAAVVEE